MEGISGTTDMISARRGPRGSVYGYSLLFMLFVYPIALVTKYKFFFLAAGLCFFAVMAGQLYKGRLAVIRKGLGRIYLFFMLALASAAWAAYPAQTVFSSGILMVFLWIYYCASASVPRDGRAFLEKAFIAVPYVCMALFAAILLKYGTIRSTSLEMTDAVGTFCNTAPALVELCFPFLAYSIISGRDKGFITIGALVSALSVIILSLSRGAYALLAVNIALLVVFSGKSLLSKISSSMKMLFVFALALSLVIAVAGYEGTVGKVVERFTSSELVEKDITDDPGVLDPSKTSPDYVRGVMYFEGASLLMELPVLGIGYDNFGDRVESKYGFRVVSHNIFVTLWGELGIAGLVLFLSIVFTAFREAFAARKDAKHRDRRDFYFHSATVVALMIALLHAQLQPQLTNPVFHAVLAAACRARYFGQP